MPAFLTRSQREVAGPAVLTAIAALLVAGSIAGCSPFSPQTVAPAQSVAASTDTPTAPPSPSPTPATTPSAAPSTPLPSLLPTSGQWRAVARELTAPAAWLDFGFAANGDLLAIGTHDATADPLHLFVERFSPSGRKRDAHNLSRSVTPIAGDWVAIDPTDDSIVIDDYLPSHRAVHAAPVQLGHGRQPVERLHRQRHQPARDRLPRPAVRPAAIRRRRERLRRDRPPRCTQPDPARRRLLAATAQRGRATR